MKLIRSRAVASTVAVLAVSLVISMMAGCEGDGKSLGSGHNFGANNENVMTALGDSITESGWPSILAGMTGKTVVNRGRGGATSSDGVGAVGSALSRDKPGFLLVQYGANDVIHLFNTDKSVENLRAIVGAAKSNRTIPVVATVMPMYRGHAAWAGGARSLSAAIRVMADEEGIRVADVEKAFGSDESLIRSDGLHPTEAGKLKIAAVFNDALN